jgi:energy-coupling factor transporter ATP-binding protein EcfA2
MYGNRRHGGIESISLELGQSIRHRITCHDDGVAARGGTMTSLIGKRGTGKTTLMLQLAQSYMHYPSNVRNRSAYELLKPETVIWRGRSYDYWNSLDPRYWESVHGLKNPKPLVIHNHISNEHYQFTVDVNGVRQELPLDKFNFKEYETEEELVKNIIPGAINVVYEPSMYFLPDYFVHQLEIRNIKIRQPLNKKKTDGEEIPVKQTPISKKYEPVETNPSVFWYPFIDQLMKLKQRSDFISLILDDANTLFEENPRGEKWHMEESFVSSIIDLRRLNISLLLSCHETGLMYWKVRRRSDFMIYLRGAYPDKQQSRVLWTLPTKLAIGQAIVEDPLIEFGLLPFDRLPNQPSMINVIGCENNS